MKSEKVKALISRIEKSFTYSNIETVGDFTSVVSHSEYKHGKMWDHTRIIVLLQQRPRGDYRVRVRSWSNRKNSYVLVPVKHLLIEVDTVEESLGYGYVLPPKP